MTAMSQVTEINPPLPEQRDRFPSKLNPAHVLNIYFFNARSDPYHLCGPRIREFLLQSFNNFLQDSCLMVNFFQLSHTLQ